jgi:hypothetical protein
MWPQDRTLIVTRSSKCGVWQMFMTKTTDCKEPITVQKCSPHCVSKTHTMNAGVVDFTLERTELTPLWLCSSSPTLKHTSFDGYVLDVLGILKSSFKADFHFSNSKEVGRVKVGWIRWVADIHQATTNFSQMVTLCSFCSSIWLYGTNIMQTFLFHSIFMCNL